MLRHFFAWLSWSVVAVCVIGFKIVLDTDPLYSLVFGFVGMIIFFVAVAATWGALRRNKQTKSSNKTTHNTVVSQVESPRTPYVLMSYKGEPYDFVHNDPTAASPVAL